MKSYSHYFCPAPQPPPWGVELSGIGHARIAPGAPYPLLGHPDDHAFDWDRGRVLRHLQCLFISTGRGVLELEGGAGPQPVEAGQLFLLYPGVWHRYTPEVDTGWTEDWLELHGPTVDQVLRGGLQASGQAVITPPDAGELAQLFHQLHTLAGTGAATDTASGAAAATLGLHLIGRIWELRERGPARRLAPSLKMEEARRHLTLHCAERLDTQALARQVGLGHVQFRRAFKEECGMSARAYHAEARLRRAGELLLHSGLSTTQIAEQLGYSSPFHFSAAFKAWCGNAPSVWRRLPDPALPACVRIP